MVLVESWLNPWYFLWSWLCRGFTTGPGCGLGCVVAVFLAPLWLYSWSCSDCTPGPVCGLGRVVAVLMVLVSWLHFWSCCACTSDPVVVVLLVLLCWVWWMQWGSKYVSVYLFYPSGIAGSNQFLSRFSSTLATCSCSCYLASATRY